jgi:hypothetical protein
VFFCQRELSSAYLELYIAFDLDVAVQKCRLEEVGLDRGTELASTLGRSLPTLYAMSISSTPHASSVAEYRFSSHSDVFSCVEASRVWPHACLTERVRAGRLRARISASRGWSLGALTDGG